MCEQGLLHCYYASLCGCGLYHCYDACVCVGVVYSTVIVRAFMGIAVGYSTAAVSILEMFVGVALPYGGRG